MGKCTWNINMLNATYGSSHRFFLRRYFIGETIIILRERKIWINAKETQRRSCSEKEKMEQSFASASGNGDCRIL